MSMDMTYFDEMEARIPRGKVRTRFAPSPTGYMHVGNLRTALYTWLIARSHGGTFILRIEDTDQGRLVEGAVDVIYRTMAECGLDHDEGPDVGGPVAPRTSSPSGGTPTAGMPNCWRKKAAHTTASAKSAPPRRTAASLTAPPIPAAICRWTRQRSAWRRANRSSSASASRMRARRRSTTRPSVILR